MNIKTILQFSIGPIGAAALSLITLPFVAWFFSVEDVGRLTMLQVILSLSVSLFSLAMHQAYVREYHEETDKLGLFKACITPGLILLSLITIITLVSPFSISNVLFGIDSSQLTSLLLIGVYGNFFINFLAHVIRMEERGLAFSLTQISPRAFLLIFISFILIFNLTPKFSTLMVMSVLSIIFSLVIFSLLTRDTWLKAFRVPLNTVLLKKMLVFSSPLVAGGLAYWGLTTMDRFFLRSLSGFEELGVYALATALAGSVTVITSIFSSLWHPILYKWAKEGLVWDRMQSVIENMALAITLIWSLAGIFSFILPVFLPTDYIDVKYLFVACVSMPLFYLFSEVTGVGIGLTRKTSYSMWASFCAFFSNAILNYLLIPIYGASGAALATMVAFFIFFIFKTEATSKLWFSFPRFKIYILMIVYIIATTIFVLLKGGGGYFKLVWLLLLVITYIMYFKRAAKSLAYIKNYLKRKI